MMSVIPAAHHMDCTSSQLLIVMYSYDLSPYSYTREEITFPYADSKLESACISQPALGYTFPNYSRLAHDKAKILLHRLCIKT